MIRHAANWTQINSGEYLDATGKRMLMENFGTDLLNVHGQVTDVMRIGWLAAELGIPVSLGNTFLEIGVHMAAALPEVEWLEYSFQNLDHLVDQPIEICDGYAYAPNRPGHGLTLSEAARNDGRARNEWNCRHSGRHRSTQDSRMPNKGRPTVNNQSRRSLG
jgi:hypothetical protein